MYTEYSEYVNCHDVMRKSIYNGMFLSFKPHKDVLGCMK